MKKGFKWFNLVVALLVMFSVTVSMGCSKKTEEAAPT